jgi:hypothetical protein
MYRLLLYIVLFILNYIFNPLNLLYVKFNVQLFILILDPDPIILLFLLLPIKLILTDSNYTIYPYIITGFIILSSIIFIKYKLYP